MREFHGDIFVLLRELSLIFIGQLQHAHVRTVAARQRHGQPATQGRMAAGMAVQPEPARVHFEFGLRQPQGPVGLADQGPHSDPIARSAQLMVFRIFFGQRLRVDRLFRAVAKVQADPCLVGANHAARLIRNLLHRAFQRLVPGDGLGGVRSALQREKVLLHIVLGLDPGADVKGHDKTGIAAGMLNRLGDDVHRKHRAVLAAVPPGAAALRGGLGNIHFEARAVFLGANIKNRHRGELLRRVTVGLLRHLVHRQELLGLQIKHPHGNRRGLKQCGVALFTVDQRLL